jgi:hypothetical protein
VDKLYKPDILIPFNKKLSLDYSCIVPVYVRPETNRVDYESVIIKSISSIGKPVFMANYNGGVIRQKHILRNHYFYRYVFALHGKNEMRKYPELIDLFEKKFKTSYENAAIYGSFEFLKDKSLCGDMKEDDLFNIYVPFDDFLKFHGLTIKKIGDFYIVNYDIPAVMSKYTDDSNIFVLMLSVNNAVNFRDVNFKIYQKFEEEDISKLLNANEAVDLTWEERVKRTYHISHNYIEAMFDMTDFILYDDYSHLHYIDTPLGKELVQRNIINPGNIDSIMNYFKRFPIVYAKEGDSFKRLLNLRDVGSYNERNKKVEYTFEECIDLFRSVII